MHNIPVGLNNPVGQLTCAPRHLGGRCQTSHTAY